MARRGVKGIWSRKAEAQETGGVWRQINRQLDENPASDSSERLSLWEAIQAQPGGMWRQVGDETIVNLGGAKGAWRDALDETIVLSGRKRDLWSEVNEETLILPRASSREIWSEVDQETVLLAKPTQNIWEELRGSRNFAEIRPIRRLGYALKRFSTARGEVYFVLKNLRSRTYLRLNERQYFLWNLMDGENTLQDIAVAYMAEYGSMDVGSLVNLLSQLETSGFLTTQGTDIYGQLRVKISGRSLGYWLKRAVESFLKREFPIRGIDKFYTRTFNAGIKYFYTKPVQILFLIITVAGLIAFGFLTSSGEYSLLKGGTSSLPFGLIALYIGRTIALFIHEGGHAYTCKHYGREIRKSGVMIYYGSLAFYVDSTDIWMEPRLPRIMVSWGGPYTSLVLGGAAALFAVISPSAALSGWAYQFAFLLIVDSIFNLNPLLKWDGYYILMDWLEMPRLRDRSLAFLRSGQVFRKLIRRKRFSRQERVFAIYGLLTAIWTGLIVGTIIWFYGETIFKFITRYIDPLWLGIGVGVLLLYLMRHRLKSLKKLIMRGRLLKLRQAE